MQTPAAPPACGRWPSAPPTLGSSAIVTRTPGLSSRVPLLAVVSVAAALVLVGCGSAARRTLTITRTVTEADATPLPGTGKPPVTVGDKNFTEQFLLGELYYLALKAQGYAVSLNRNIGPTEVTLRALESGTLSLYPEYLSTWNRAVAGIGLTFRSKVAAYRAAESFALAHGFQLLNPTPFSDTPALAVDFNYGVQNGLSSIADLQKVAPTLTLGAPPQFQQGPEGMPALARVYGVVPAYFKALEVGAQYQALNQGVVQAADVTSTDGQLITGNYTLLSDPQRIFGWGNVVPVVPLKVIEAEGPQFAATINRVSAVLSTSAIRQMNAAVDLDNQDPGTVAANFLQAHGLIPSRQQ